MNKRPLVDLSWMNKPSSVVFGQRRQGEPPLDTVDTLRSIWQRNLPRIGPIPNRDEYSPNLETPKNPDFFQQSVRLASQKMHFGWTAKQAQEWLASQVGEEMAAQVDPFLSGDEGLVGKVFVRASVFPEGLARWAPELKKRCAGVKYVVDQQVRPLTKKEAGGRLLRVVTEVPWVEAYQEYRGMFASFVPLPIVSANPKEDLRRAFLYLERGTRTAPLSAQIRDTGSVNSLTQKPIEAGEIRPDMKLRRQIEKLAQQDILDARAAGRLLVQDRIDPFQVEAAVKECLVRSAQGGTFQGPKMAAEKWVSRPVVKAPTPTPVVKKKATVKPTIDCTPPKPGFYEGTVFRSLPVLNPKTQIPQPSLSERLASQCGVRPVDIDHCLHRTRSLIAQGVSGEDLIRTIRSDHDPKVVDACQSVLTQMRQAHEGRAGIQYVWAEAHLSGNGEKGCVEGAKKLRSSIHKPPYVLGSSRCEGCSRRIHMEGQPETCLVYGLPLKKEVS